MKSITIHNMDDSIATLIETEAKNQNTSMNKTIKNLLGAALGVAPSHKLNSDFTEFTGVWSDVEKDDFNKRVMECEVIDKGDWE